MQENTNTLTLSIDLRPWISSTNENLFEEIVHYLSYIGNIIPIDITIIKGINELETDFVDNILIQDKIDVNKKNILKRLFILWNIEQGKKVRLKI